MSSQKDNNEEENSGGILPTLGAATAFIGGITPLLWPIWGFIDQYKIDFVYKILICFVVFLSYTAVVLLLAIMFSKLKKLRTGLFFRALVIFLISLVIFSSAAFAVFETERFFVDLNDKINALTAQLVIKDALHPKVLEQGARQRLHNHRHHTLFVPPSSIQPVSQTRPAIGETQTTASKQSALPLLAESTSIADVPYNPASALVLPPQKPSRLRNTLKKPAQHRSKAVAKILPNYTSGNGAARSLRPSKDVDYSHN